jgi:hypothetical protein
MFWLLPAPLGKNPGGAHGYTVWLRYLYEGFPEDIIKPTFLQFTDVLSYKSDLVKVIL